MCNQISDNNKIYLIYIKNKKFCRNVSITIINQIAELKIIY